MGIAEFIIGRAFARPVGSTHHADCDCYGAGTDSRLEMLRPRMS